MKIAIIDADLIGRQNHRFPNLACMKLSSYYKSLGNSVVLKLDYNELTEYNKVFISKVFTDTHIDESILCLPNVEYGGTGFFYDKAPDRENQWDENFWKQDLYDLWKRIELLMKYHCLPYIMRYNRYIESPYKGQYILISRWCNQPSFYKKNSLREYCGVDQKDKKKEGASFKYLKQIEKEIPDLAQKYFDMKYEHFLAQNN